MNFNKNLIVIIEIINETTQPVNNTKLLAKVKVLPAAKNLTIFSKLAPNIVGIPKKNENSVEIKREQPINIAPKIVAPERDVPGIKAKTWKKPMNNAVLYVKSAKVAVFGLRFWL